MPSESAEQNVNSAAKVHNDKATRKEMTRLGIALFGGLLVLRVFWAVRFY